MLYYNVYEYLFSSMIDIYLKYNMYNLSNIKM